MKRLITDYFEVGECSEKRLRLDEQPEVDSDQEGGVESGKVSDQSDEEVNVDPVSPGKSTDIWEVNQVAYQILQNYY